MRAMILAAGLGTRLRPLTDTTPKPLVKLAGKPMISYVLDMLDKYGFHEVLVNTHYLPHQISQYVSQENHRHSHRKLFIQDESDKILGSGGAIAKASSWLFEHQSRALICNADTLMKPNLLDLCESHAELHAKKGVEVTLAVMPHIDAGKKYTGLRCVDGLVRDFVPADPKNTEKLFHFPGAYVIEQTAANRLPVGRDSSISELVWQPLAKQNKLGAWEYHGPYQDLGTVHDLELAEKMLAGGEF